MASTQPAPFVRPPTSQEVIRDELLRRLSVGEFEVGEVIRQDTIAQQLGVSRVPVREALKELVGMGILAYEPRHGHRVRELSTEALAEITTFRQLLESAVARAAAERITLEEMAALEADADSMEQLAETGDLTDLREVTHRFHMTIYRASRMDFFVEQIEYAWRRMRAYRALLVSPNDDHTRMHAEHRAMIEALRNGDGDELVRLQDQHRRTALGDLAPDVTLGHGGAAVTHDAAPVVPEDGVSG